MRTILVSSLTLTTLLLLNLNSCAFDQNTSNQSLLDENFSGRSVSHGGPDRPFDPSDLKGEKNFAKLINQFQQGKTEPTPWAGYWWPYTRNGIAAGGFTDNASPAGKYDAARGHTTHAQEWEVKNHGAGVPKVQQWWGHCNGWCAASALFKEPHESIKVNQINFGIGDIKALLTEASMSVNADFFGERIDIDDPNSPKYWDTVPDQYFLVLTNYIGKLKRAVLIDRYTGSQVWNQPLAGYRFDYPKPSDYLGNSTDAPHVYKILLTSTMWWLDDGVAPDVQTHAFNFEEEDPTGVVQSRVLKMELWLDGPVEFGPDGKIVSSGDVIVTKKNETYVGGAWMMGEGYLVDAWPDYMWVPYTITKPFDPDEDYVNPYVDAEWLKTHLLVPGGADDQNVTPGNIEAAPGTQPAGLPYPYGGLPFFPGGTPNFPTSAGYPYSSNSSSGSRGWPGTWPHSRVTPSAGLNENSR
jgi:hypothetical protein